MKSTDEVTPDEKISKLKHRSTNAMVNGHLEVTDSRVSSDDEKKQAIDDVTVAELRTRMQELSESISGHVNDRINDIISQVLSKFETSLRVSDNLSDKYSDKRKSSKGSILPEKQFLARNSLLTELFTTNKHVRSMYNVFITILIILFLNTAAYDITHGGSLNVGVNTIILGFGKFSSVLYIWLLMTFATLGIYIPFNFWANKRLDFLPISSSLKVWDYGWLAGFVLYLLTFIVLPTKAVIDEGLPAVSSTVVLMEQVRMLMKSYAFVRSTAPKFLAYKVHTDMEKPVVPDFSKYLYFFFAPTLIYRDSYPRTRSIRWKFALWHYFEVVLAIFYVAFICERFFMTTYGNYGVRPMGKGELLLNVINMSMPGILFFLCGFYCLLHSWLNACAEVLRFADRLFYKDWWNSSSYTVYYRTWNVVVHDWLYTYIYRDVYEILTNQNRLIAASSVFFISAIFHEYLLAFGFRFFCPIMLVMFGVFGFAFTFVTKGTGNMFMWLTLCLGNGFMCSMYAIEFFARRNCAPYPDEVLDLMLPRSWYCNAISE